MACVEDISQAYCHKVNMDIGDVADSMDWRFFADCARDEEFGLPLEDDSSDEGDSVIENEESD